MFASNGFLPHQFHLLSYFSSHFNTAPSAGYQISYECFAVWNICSLIRVFVCCCACMYVCTHLSTLVNPPTCLNYVKYIREVEECVSMSQNKSEPLIIITSSYSLIVASEQTWPSPSELESVGENRLGALHRSCSYLLSARHRGEVRGQISSQELGAFTC